MAHHILGVHGDGDRIIQKQVMSGTAYIVPCPVTGAATWRIQWHNPGVIARLY